MKDTDKITLTVGQLKKLIKESNEIWYVINGRWTSEYLGDEEDVLAFINTNSKTEAIKIFKSYYPEKDGEGGGWNIIIIEQIPYDKVQFIMDEFNKNGVYNDPNKFGWNENVVILK